VGAPLEEGKERTYPHLFLEKSSELQHYVIKENQTNIVVNLIEQYGTKKIDS